MKYLRDRLELFLVVAALGLLAGGMCFWLLDFAELSAILWTAGALLGLAFSVVWTIDALIKRKPSVDVIAVLALGGALWVNEPFAGAMITVMLGTGRLLEARAQARARRELRLLMERAPRTARRRTGDGLETVAIDELKSTDRLLIGTGEVLPVDGRLLSGATLDESALTGESLPVERFIGETVRSGVLNAGAPVDLMATAAAADSTYAGVIRLVEQAQASSAPFVRTADRFALVFVPVTLVLAAAAWLLSSDPVRAVAVLVVATPCPLLLAAPIAIISGLSRAAGIGVVIKGGGALERLAAGKVALFDKTGTLTRGQPSVAEILVADDSVDAHEILRLAASLDQVSPHVLASSIVTAATRRHARLELPTKVHEEHGYGLRGYVGNQEVRLGKASWIAPGDQPAWVLRARHRAEIDGSLTVFIAVDGVAAGAFLLNDPIRPDAPRMIRTLRGAGIERVVLVTGDRADVADTVGRIVGADAIRSDCDPAEKLRVITHESGTAASIMVGDGVNDAPALAAAGVGVALAARGATASSEAADVVLTVDRIDALADAILIARRSLRIGRQAVFVGMGLSLIAMVAAAVGLLAPAPGAVLQEVIDVMAIGIALRAVLPGKAHSSSMTPADLATVRELKMEHDSLGALVEKIRAVADELSESQPDLGSARTLAKRLDTELLPHERQEEKVLVPLVSRTLGDDEGSSDTSRTHAEIELYISRLHRMIDGIDGPGTSADIVDIRGLLYGLYAILKLHNTLEDEGAFSLLPS